MDRYLSHYLKNWIVRQPLPSDRREELLAKAAENNKRAHKFDRMSQGEQSELERLLPGQWSVPMTQSRVWLFNMTLNVRMVT